LLGLEPLAGPDWLINKPDLPQGSQPARLGALYAPLAEMVSATVNRGQRPVSIAGDCCTAIGVLSGLQRAGLDPLLIWFDAHGDFNTWETTPSGFLGGMPLAMLVGRGEQTICEALGLQAHPEAQVILTDGRDLDPRERLALENSAVTHLANAQDLCEYPLPRRPLYVHFDTDVITPDEAPAMNYLAPGGPTAKQMQRIFHRLTESGQVIAVSLSSWNPAMDLQGYTRQVCLHLLNILIENPE
jgi:arginase